MGNHGMAVGSSSPPYRVEVHPFHTILLLLVGGEHWGDIRESAPY